MIFLKNCLKGIAIGAGAILPGISSGVICVILGIYEKLLNSLLNFFKDIKNNFKYLFPIIIGCCIGIFIVSNFLNYFFVTFPIQTKSIFIGLLLGCVPSLIKQCNNKVAFKFNYLLFTLVAFLFTIFFIFIEKTFNFNDLTNFGVGYLFISGFIMSIGIVVPGISNTIILMLMGVYSTYLSAVSSIYLPVLIPMGLGVLIGCMIFMFFTRFLLSKFYAQTFYSIIGFSIGSILILFPNISFDISFFICFFCILLGFLISSFFKEKT